MAKAGSLSLTVVPSTGSSDQSARGADRPFVINPRVSEAISTLDIFKIGVGPSSSHTMGPWRAAQRFIAQLAKHNLLHLTTSITTELYGSLAKTGKGHGTDVAVILGLIGEDPVTCVVEGLQERVDAIIEAGRLHLRACEQGAAVGPARPVGFEFSRHMILHMDQALPFHPNGVQFTAQLDDNRKVIERYYSVGGGFVVQESEEPGSSRSLQLPHPIDRAEDITLHLKATGVNLPGLVLINERAWRSDDATRDGLLSIWRTMQECVFRGCHTGGILPGGLGVVRRGQQMHERLMEGRKYDTLDAWMRTLRTTRCEFQQILRWVSAFALAVNEENAAFGRVVTAPTNGAAGVIPAVMMYAACFIDLDRVRPVLPCPSAPEPRRDAAMLDFLLVAGIIGTLFKKGATISAAMGGCQAEIGVSSAMAAAGLTHLMGGNPARCMMAAEIAMEHHLGMTCDPIGGLVQVPCIERNTMGAMKAITAANIAMDSDPASAKVSLDSVISTMWATALDMQSKYKETSEGGLAIHVPVSVSEC
jgi:L-serine dehydratase